MPDKLPFTPQEAAKALDEFQSQLAEDYLGKDHSIYEITEDEILLGKADHSAAKALGGVFTVSVFEGEHKTKGEALRNFLLSLTIEGDK